MWGGYWLDQLLTRAPLLRSPRFQRLVDRATGADGRKWSRVVMRDDCERWIAELGAERLKVLEISGNHYADLPFAEYRIAAYPDYDVCAGPLPDTFDLVIAEQVFEHLLRPYAAARNVHAMLRPGGHFLISTPFLVRVHDYPVDCTRWTETGLRGFLAESGFEPERIRTASWGNRACVNANFHDWTRFRPRLHSLANEPAFPYHVWALAQK